MRTKDAVKMELREMSNLGEASEGEIAIGIALNMVNNPVHPMQVVRFMREPQHPSLGSQVYLARLSTFLIEGKHQKPTTY